MQQEENDLNESYFSSKEKENVDLLINNTINKNITPILNKLLDRYKDVQKKEKVLLNIIQHNHDLILKQNQVNQIQKSLNNIQSTHKENQVYSKDNLKEIIDVLKLCIGIFHNQYNNNEELTEYMNNEIKIKNIIADCLLQENKKDIFSNHNKKQKQTSLNNYVNNSLFRKGNIQHKHELSIRITKKRDTHNINKHFFGESTSRPNTNLSSSHLMGHSDTLTSYLNQKCESNITEKSTKQKGMNNSKEINSSYKKKFSLKKPLKRIVHRNNYIISKNHLRTYSVENSKIKRSISTVSKQSRIETSKETLSKKKSIKSERYAELFVNMNSASERSNPKLTKKFRNDEHSKILDKTEGDIHIQTKEIDKINEGEKMQSINNKTSRNNDTNYKRGNGSVPKKRDIKKVNSNNICISNIHSNSKSKSPNKIAPPSLLNDYDIKKEKIKNKAKLSCLIHVLNKLYKMKIKEMRIQCFYDLLLLNKQKIQLLNKAKQKLPHKLTLKIYFRKCLLDFILFSLKTVIPIYNKKKKKYNFEKQKQANKITLSNNISKTKSKILNNNSQYKKSNSNSIDKKDQCFDKLPSQHKKLKPYIPNKQNSEREYKKLIPKSSSITNKKNRESFEVTIEPNDCIHTEDELLNKKSTIELLEEQQEQFDINEQIIQINKKQNLKYKKQQREVYKNGNHLGKDCLKMEEDFFDISNDLEYNDSKSVPTTPFNKIDLNINGFSENKTNNNYNYKEIEIDSDEEEGNENDCMRYYEGLNRLKDLIEETKKIETNMKVFLEGV